MKKLVLWGKRMLLAFAILLITLAIAGMVYQSIGETADARRLLPPGQLVDVGGYRMHLNCQGEGDPAVILEALSGGTSSYWAWVQPELAKTTRVCAYDRAGRGWSEPRPAGSEDYAGQTVRELNSLLTNGGVPGPYILVGHSIGGIYARLYADRYPGKVVGLVLLDASHPQQYNRIPELVEENENFLRQSAVFPWLARLGLFRLYFSTGGELDFQDLPARQHNEVAAAWSSPGYFRSQRAEVIAAPGVFAQGRNLGNLGDLPLVVISAAEGLHPRWHELQKDLATLSSDVLHITIPGATHTSLVFNREHAGMVREVIQQLVKAVRESRPLLAQ